MGIKYILQGHIMVQYYYNSIMNNLSKWKWVLQRQLWTYTRTTSKILREIIFEIVVSVSFCLRSWRQVGGEHYTRYCQFKINNVIWNYGLMLSVAVYWTMGLENTLNKPMKKMKLIVIRNWQAK